MLSKYMRQRIKTNRLLALVLSGITLISIGCGVYKEKVSTPSETIKIQENGGGSQAASDDAAQADSETQPQDEVVTASILAVGDDLIHSGLYKSGIQDDGTYNYDHLYQYVKDDVSAADLAIVNQETILINDRNNLSGYPAFGSPVEFADALVNCGFDVVLHATNHVLDKGSDGVHQTMDYWSEHFPDITVLGIHDSQEDADTVKVVDVNGIKIAMLNYTYGMNGYTLPENEPYLVDVLEKDRVGEMIDKAKEVSDMVIFFAHVGTEYTYEPSEYSKEWVNYLLEKGVDIAIDSHPHVLEPYTMLTGEDGHQMLVYYSMGNFISTQDEVPRLLGGMAKINIEKRTENGETTVSVTDYTLEPLISHWNHNTGEYAVYKLEDYTDDLAAAHALSFTVQDMKDLFDEIMNTEVTPATGVLGEDGTDTAA